MSKIYIVEFTDTLMMWTGEFHVEAGERESYFYFRVPDEWAGSPTLQMRVFEVAQQMYEETNARLHAAEPEDLGYLLVKSTRAVPLREADEGAQPWLLAKTPAAWEWTPCVVVEEDGSYRKVSREEF